MKITKNNLYQFIFIACAAVPYLNNYELTFSVWVFSILVSLRKTYSKLLIYQIVCFSTILIIAFYASFFNDFLKYDFVRDITYLLKPILGLLIGYQLCRGHLINPFKTIINAGVFLAVLHLIIIGYSFLALGVRDIHELRFYAGYFSDFEVYALIAVIFSDELGVTLSTKTKVKYMVIIAISALFYLSRINFIEFVILFMAMKGYFVITKRTIIVLSSIIVACLLFYSAILYVNPRRNGKGFEAFLYKVKIAPIEPFKTRFKKDDWKDFNDNYRSVENILTTKQMTDDGTATILHGKGLGSRIDLNTEVELDGVKMKYISILHNGFMTVFLKSGALGILLLLTSIFVLLKCKRSNPEFKYLNHMIAGTVLFLLLSYWVFMGLYFKADTKSIVIGLVIAAYDKRRIELKSS